MSVPPTKTAMMESVSMARALRRAATTALPTRVRAMSTVAANAPPAILAKDGLGEQRARQHRPVEGGLQQVAAHDHRAEHVV